VVDSKQIKMARIALGLSPKELAKRAQVAVTTITRFESYGATPSPIVVVALRSALERAGAEFADDGWVRVRYVREHSDVA
jgi:ribosome-binding protein aMBF1 (putative translation factor)